MLPALRDVLECVDYVHAFTSTDNIVSAATVPLAVRRAIRLIISSLVSNYAIAVKQLIETRVTVS